MVVGIEDPVKSEDRFLIADVSSLFKTFMELEVFKIYNNARLAHALDISSLNF